MHQDIIDNSGNSDATILKRTFILNLGPEFTEIGKKYDLGQLLPEWDPMNLHELLPVTKRFLQATMATRSRNKDYKEANKLRSASGDA